MLWKYSGEGSHGNQLSPTVSLSGKVGVRMGVVVVVGVRVISTSGVGVSVMVGVGVGVEVKVTVGVSVLVGVNVAVGLAVSVGVPDTVEVGVMLGGAEVAVGVSVGGTTMTRTQKGEFPSGPIPNHSSWGFSSIQFPWCFPPFRGATISIAISTLSPGGTLPSRGTVFSASIAFPEKSATAYSSVQVHPPLLYNRQTFVNDSPGSMVVSSGIVISIGMPGAAISHTRVGEGVIRCGEGVRVRDTPCVKVGNTGRDVGVSLDGISGTVGTASVFGAFTVWGTGESVPGTGVSAASASG
jgi:hypothetical protein